MELVSLHDPAIHGESPHWSQEQQCLYWVDIIGQSLRLYYPTLGRHRKIKLPEPIGHAVVCHSGGMILSLVSGIYHLDLDNEQLTIVTPFNQEPSNNRPNDGKCDPQGRLWIGTMDNDISPGRGNLYCLDQQGQLHRQLSELTFANGLAWQPQSNEFYFIDSINHRVINYPYNPVNGSLGPGQEVISIDQQYGMPDGMCIDRDGMLWIAGFGGSHVMRFNPDSGLMIARYELPVSHPTSCTFGGAALNELFITTSRLLLDEEQINLTPSAGCLYKLVTETVGYPDVAYAG